ncbi:MAG: exosome complex RNA-binding protein Csl4 [Candidatus Altiarchaeota archaeon]
MSEEEDAFIGDYIGTIEEFMPGPGTFVDEEGKICSSAIGKKKIDGKNHSASVEANIPHELAIGDIVYGEVCAFRKNLVTVIVKKIKGYKNDVDIKTAIFISQISDSYVENPEEAFGVGDLVKAQVVKMETGLIDISTKGELGVVLAYCKRCRTPMERTEKFKDRLECPACNHREGRKIAKDYRNVDLKDM